jgi:DNA repair exonuclease SbcCD ATPase subunit
MVLTNRNEELVIELGRLKKAHEDLQKETESLTELKSKQEDLKWAEMDVINMNLESNRRQLSELQRENELLRAEVDANKVNTPPMDLHRIKEMETDVATLQKRLEEEQSKSKIVSAKKVLNGQFCSYLGPRITCSDKKIRCIQRCRKILI